MTAEEFGTKIRLARKAQQLTQPDLAMVAGTGLRFIVDLEGGKKTCQLEKALQVAAALGLLITIGDGSECGGAEHE